MYCYIRCKSQGSDHDFLLIKPAVLQVPVDLRVALMINEILLLTHQRDISKSVIVTHENNLLTNNSQNG
jgi:hypothetical protein